MIYGLGVQELLIILVIVMILFGGKRLPEVGRNLGKALRGFKDAEEKATKELREAEKAAATPAEPEEKEPPAPHGEEKTADASSVGPEEGGERGGEETGEKPA